VLAGITADLVGFAGAVWTIGALTFASGIVAAVRMTETRLLAAATPATRSAPQAGRA
jgi:uncharacterized membrane protein YgdD (TMEM256/DUF423 family)